MPSEIYEVVAQGARYWFLFLMSLIVWRSYRWYRRDGRQAKKRLKLLPDAGFVGEMVVMEGAGALKRGDALPVPCEGTLGTLRSNDLCVPVSGVSKRHLWFRFDEGEGLLVEALHGNAANVDGEDIKAKHAPVYMAHGSRLYVGEAVLRLRLFAGFEGVSRAPVREEAPAHAQPKDEGQAAYPGQQAAAMSPAQQAAMRQWMQQQWMMRQQMMQQYSRQQEWQRQAYQQWLEQQWMQQQAAAEAYADDAGTDEEARETSQELDPTPFMRPSDVPPPDWMLAGNAGSPSESESVPAHAQEEASPSEEEPWPYMPYPHSDVSFEDGGYTYPDIVEPDELDEDITDAAAPPRSAYIGHDEAEHAKRKLWDKYFGGGHGR